MTEVHKIVEPPGVDPDHGIGMDEGDIREIITSLANSNKRVWIVKAGTGTGKSTYSPQAVDPPEGRLPARRSRADRRDRAARAST